MNTFDENLALSYLDNDPQFLVQVVKAMQDILAEQQPVMTQALNHDNFVRMRQCTHSHLPTLKILGLTAAAQVFEMFESAVSRDDSAALSHLKTAVMSQWHDAQKVLSDWLSNQVKPERLIPVQQNDPLSYKTTTPRFFPIDGP
jgi:HPt (histidine-containing phosphotransfer) domain-containing protein